MRLLDYVRQFMTEEPFSSLSPKVGSHAAKDDMLADGVRSGAHLRGRAHGVGIGMDPHARKIVIE